MKITNERLCYIRWTHTKFFKNLLKNLFNLHFVTALDIYKMVFSVVFILKINQKKNILLIFDILWIQINTFWYAILFVLVIKDYIYQRELISFIIYSYFHIFSILFCF